MILTVSFKESDKRINTEFKETYRVSDGSYDVGYQQGYQQGLNDAQPTETIEIINNGTYDVRQIATANVNVPIPEGYLKPTGTLTITDNGYHEVSEFKLVDVEVPIPEGYIIPDGILKVYSVGSYDVTKYAKATFSVPTEEKTFTPTKEVQEYAPEMGYITKAVVEPIPEEYIIPVGEFSVDENGSYDITEYASININVPIPEGYLVPEGTFAADIEGSYDVTPYAEAVFTVQKEQVNVIPTEETQTLIPTENKFFDQVVVERIPEAYLIPEGTIDITNTQEYDVTKYSTAQIKDENLKAENIAENVEVLGITGTFRGGIYTNDATATSDDLLFGKIAYANEQKLVGTIETYDYSTSEEVSPEVDKLINRTITEYYNNRVRSIAPSVFYGYTTLVKVDFPNVTEIGSTAFARTGLVEVNFPKVTLIGSQAFANNSTLKKIYLPSIKDLTANSLREMTGLEEVYLDEVNKISANSLYACYMLKKLVIRNKKEVASLTSPLTLSLCYHITGTVNATYNPNGDKDGYIYVDDDLVDAYKVATN